LGKIIVVTSGKGGVGKTTTSAAFASGLALRGHQTVVIDFDVGLRNLDLVMGCERRVVYDFVNVINGEGNLNQALIKDKRIESLFILPASQTRNKEIEHGAIMAMYFSDEALIVTNPEVSSVRDSDRIIGMLSSKTRRAVQNLPPVKEHLLLTRYIPKRVNSGDMLSVQDVQDILAIPLLGVIPESKSVLQASNAGIPITLDKKSDAGQAYLNVVARFLGEDPPPREKKGFLTRWFGK